MLVSIVPSICVQLHRSVIISWVINEVSPFKGDPLLVNTADWEWHFDSFSDEQTAGIWHPFFQPRLLFGKDNAVASRDFGQFSSVLITMGDQEILDLGEG